MRRVWKGLIVLAMLLVGCVAASPPESSPTPTAVPATATPAEPTLTPTYFASPTPAPALVESTHPASLPPAPGQLIVLQAGHLSALDSASGDLAPVLDTGYVADPVLSSDGKQLAYLYYPSDPAQNPSPAEVWSVTLEDGTATRLAGVRVDADPGLVRTAPTWSPDGSQVAWGELDPSADSLPGYLPYTAVAADVASGRTEAISPLDLTPDFADTLPPVDWGERGLAYLQPQPTWTASFGAPPILLVYNTRGIIGVNAPINPLTIGYRWVQTPDGQRLALLYGDGSWDLIDAGTSTSELLSGGLMMTNAAAPDGPALYVVAHPDPAGMATLDGWLVDAAGQVSPLLAGAVSLNQSRVAIADDGTVAFLSPEGVTLWNDGDSQVVAGTEMADAIFGGAPLWQTVPADALSAQGVTYLPPLTENTTCTPGSSIQPGQSAEINELPPNEGVVLWAEQAPLHKFLLMLAPGSTFDVLDGVFCTGWQLGPVVWKVSVNGDEGYVAEPSSGLNAPPLFQTIQR